MKLYFDVKNQVITRTDRNQVIANSADYLEAEITFSDEWSSLEKTMTFKNGNLLYTYVLENNKILSDNHLNLGVGTWKVSIQGVSGDQKIITNECNLAVNASGWIGSEAIPPESIWNQLLVIIESLHTEVASTAALRSAVQKYIEDNYDALVKEEVIVDDVRAALDDMAEDGTLSDLLAPLVAAGMPSVVADQISAVVAAQIGATVASQIGAVVASQITAPVNQAVKDYCDDNFSGWSGALDRGLTQPLMAAPADMVGAIKSALSDLTNATVIVSANLLDKSAITANTDLRDTGATGSRNGYFTTDYIPIDEVLSFWRDNGSSIVAYGAFKSAQYDTTKTFISGSYTTSTGLTMYTVSAVTNAKYVRLTFANTYLNADIGCYEGTTAPSVINDFGNMELNIPNSAVTTEKISDGAVTPSKLSFQVVPNVLYTFEDAFVHWQNGEKFPIMFCGDSTTDGPNTPNNDIDNPTDFVDTDAYPYILQGLLRSVTNNNILRCYNAGYSGKSLRNFIDAYDNIMTVYGDAKMAGISFGINDVATDPFYYYNHGSTLGFITKLCKLVEMFYADGIQPFMITSQVICQNNASTHREQYRVQQWCNQAKFDVAKKYGIPCVDIAEMTQLFNLYSSKASSEIYQNLNHYSAIGHAYEAGVFFKELYPLVRSVNGRTIIGVGDMYLKTDIGESIEMISTDANGFKFQWNATELSEDVVVLDSWVFVENKGEMQLTGYCSSAMSQVVTVDGDDYTMNDVTMDICKLDVGLHHIQVTSNGQSSTNFKGFIIS